MTEKEKAAFKIVDEVCADFRGSRRERGVIEASLQIIHTALDPKDDEKKDDEKKDETTDEKKVKVPRRALPRDRKRKDKKK